MFTIKNEVILIMQIFKANVSKSMELYQRVKFWLEDNQSFTNVYQALSHDDKLSEKLFHEEILVAYGFVTGCRARYFERHCFFIEQDEVIDVTFNNLHKLELQEYTIIELYTFSNYLKAIEYEYRKSLNEMNLKLNC